MYQKKNNLINGIIAEFNPFHSGHKYLIEEAKNKTGAKYTVIVMSGNYTQRGTPAFFDKYIRTEMALRCGADLVLELPTAYATSSAEIFARGGVSILDKLNCVDCLCFGSESGNLETLTVQAEKVMDETSDSSELVKEYLKEGKTYPQSLSLALGDDTPSMPNDILAVEYIKALKKYESDMILVTIKRCDNGYSELSLSNEGKYSSAASIREAIIHDNDSWVKFIPSELSNTDFFKSPFILSNDFSQALLLSLLNNINNGYEDFLDVTKDLSNRIIKNIKLYKDVESFALILKSRNYTLARIYRCLLHIMLGIHKSDILDDITQVRVLGMKKDAHELMGILNEKTSINLITKPAKEELSPMLVKDILCSELYMHTMYGEYSEYSRPIITI